MDTVDLRALLGQYRKQYCCAAEPFWSFGFPGRSLHGHISYGHHLAQPSSRRVRSSASNHKRVILAARPCERDRPSLKFVNIV